MERIPEQRIFEHADQAIQAASERMGKEVCIGCPHYLKERCDLSTKPANVVHA